MWKAFKVTIPKDGTKVALGTKGIHGHSTNLRLRHMGTLPVYIGGEDVKADDGFPFLPKEALLFERIGPSSQLFATAGSPVATDQELRVLWRDI